MIPENNEEFEDGMSPGGTLRQKYAYEFDQGQNNSPGIIFRKKRDLNDNGGKGGLSLQMMPMERENHH